MCLIIDDREETTLTRHLLQYDLTVVRQHLDFGDACFEGSGPSGPALIGIERKRLPDLISSIQSRRLSGHQISGMTRLYDYSYLVIEGFWRPNKYGSIEELQGGTWKPLFHQRQGIDYRQVDSYLDSLSTVEPRITVCRTANLDETAALYVSRYNHWQKPWSSRHSRDVIYAPGPASHKAHPGEPPLVAKFAAQLPGIDQKAWAVAKHFRTPIEMVFADEKEWVKIPGIGRKTAKEVVDKLSGKA